jgi:hypothetical protein
MCVGRRTLEIGGGGPDDQKDAGTNVNEQVISKINLKNETRLAGFPYNASLPDATMCTGTHTIVYSRVNKQ